MRVRQLIECTVDLAHPLAELSAVINAVLSTIPDVEQRAEILRKLDDEFVTALHALDDTNTPEEAVV